MRSGAGAREDREGKAGEEVDAAVRVLPPRRRRVVPHAPGKWRGGRPRYSWAELLKRVFLVDVLTCPRCGGERKVLAAIHDPAAIRKVLEALGLPFEVPVLAAARPPPPGQGEMEFG